MRHLLDSAALLVTAMGLAVGCLSLLRVRAVLPSLAILLDFLTAAGLLRLAAAPDIERVCSAAAVLAVRHLITWSLRRSTTDVEHSAAATKR